MKPIKNTLLFLGKNFLTGFIIMLGALVALLGVQAFQSLTTNPSNSGNQSLQSPILTKNGGTFNRDVHSLEAIARFLGIGAATGYKRVFVTSTTYNGNLGGVAGADTICQNTANSGSLGGNWTAFLSDSTSNFITRYGTDHTKYLYTNLLGFPIFTSGLPGFFQNGSFRKSAADFLTYNILTNENGTITQNPYYWTSTSTQGIFYSAPQHCLNWTNGTTSYYAYYGLNNPFSGPGAIDSLGNPAALNNFYYYSTYSCNNSLTLLCVER